MQDKKWWFVMVLALLSIGANFWGFPVYVLDEAKNSACAMEMFQRGDWVMPTFNGQLRTDKPPLHYFFMMASYSVFGITPFAARFFSVVMGLLTVASVYFFTRRMTNERTAWFSGLAMVSSVFVIAEFHLAVPDPYFIFFLTFSWLAFAYALTTGRSGYFLLSYLSVGLAFMAKGPAAVVLSGVVFLALLYFRGQLTWAFLKTIRLPVGVLSFLTVTVPWWVAVWLRTDGEWVKGFLLGHNVDRFLAPYEDHGSFPGMAILVLLVALLPLSPWLPASMVRVWRDQRGNALLMTSFLAVVVVILFFSISRTFLANYIGPAVPFAAILIGFAIDHAISHPPARARFWVGLSVFLFIGLIGVLVFAIRQDRWISEMPELAGLFLPWPIGAFIAWWLLGRGKQEIAWSAYLLSFWMACVLIFQLGVPRILEVSPVQASLSIVKGTDREVIGYRLFNPAYVFALQRPLLTYFTAAEVISYARDRRVMVLTRKEHQDDLTAVGFRVVFEQPYLFEGPTAVLMISPN
jgi:4-amino-4-deoxy-L-arabinose transferase-like glycosyltransferase